MKTNDSILYVNIEVERLCTYDELQDEIQARAARDDMDLEEAQAQFCEKVSRSIRKLLDDVDTMKLAEHLMTYEGDE